MGIQHLLRVWECIPHGYPRTTDHPVSTAEYNLGMEYVKEKVAKAVVVEDGIGIGKQPSGILHV